MLRSNLWSCKNHVVTTSREPAQCPSRLNGHTLPVKLINSWTALLPLPVSGFERGCTVCRQAVPFPDRLYRTVCRLYRGSAKVCWVRRCRLLPRCHVLPPAAALMPWAVAGAALLAADARLALHHDDPFYKRARLQLGHVRTACVLCTMWCCCATIPHCLSVCADVASAVSSTPHAHALAAILAAMSPQAVETPPPRLGQCVAPGPRETLLTSCRVRALGVGASVAMVRSTGASPSSRFTFSSYSCAASIEMRMGAEVTIAHARRSPRLLPPTRVAVDAQVLHEVLRWHR